jgi:hypothetical protein
MKDESSGGTKFWVLIVDDCTDYCCSYFVKSKDKLKSKVIELFEELNDKGIFVSYVMIYDIGENASN